MSFFSKIQNTKFFIFLFGAFLLLFVSYLGYRSGDRVEASQSAPSQVFLPLTIYRYDPTLPPPVFGVQMYNDTSTSSPYHPYLLQTRATWLRSNVIWDLAEPANTTPDNYNWASADRSLSAARIDTGGLNMIATVAGNPAWAATHKEGVIDKVSYSELAQFVGALVERYDGDGLDDAPGNPVVEYWEIYNEPDRAGDTASPAWGDDGDKYAAMLQVVYPAVKAANPNAQVVMGGIAYDAFEDQGGSFVRSFMDDVLAAGGGNYFDVMNFHAYPAFNLNWVPTEGDGPGLYEKTLAIRSKLQSYGFNKPIVVTEAGWHSSDHPTVPGSQEIQARYVTELFTQAMAADLDVMIWWMLFDPGGGYPFDNGLVTNADSTITTKASFTAFQVGVDFLSTSRFEAVLKGPALGTPATDVVAYQFDDKTLNRKVYVAWVNPVVTGQEYLIQINGSQATVYNIYGQKLQTVQDGSDGVLDGKVSIVAEEQPRYIEVPK